MPTAESSTNKDIAIILAGGVAKGAFEAGALDVITSAPIRIKRIVAASSGALNGTVMGAAIRQGDPKAGAARLVDLWSTRATWSQFFDFSFSDLFNGRSLSTANRVLALLREQVQATLTTGQEPISVRFVTAAIEGVIGNIGPRPATTFEAVLRFEGTDYDTEEGREKIFNGALASSAFPGLFPPRELQFDGRTIHGVDGGVVANTPVGAALRDLYQDARGRQDAGVSTVVVVAPYPEIVNVAPALTGTGLISEILEMLVEERLYTDLREAEDTNRTIDKLEALSSQGFTPEQIATVTRLVLAGKHRVQVVPIRPPTVLTGTPFSGFFDRSLRDEYISLGKTQAEAALKAAGLL